MCLQSQHGRSLRPPLPPEPGKDQKRKQIGHVAYRKSTSRGMSEPETETPFRLPPCLLTEPKNLRYIHFFYLYEYVYLIFSVFPARIRNGATNSLPDSFLSPPPGLEQSFSSTPTPGSPTNRKGSNPAAFRIKLKAFPCYPCSGYNLGISVVDPLVIREEQRSYETGNYAFNNKFWQNF